MLPSTKKKNRAHRVPCVCHAFDCYLGHYIDAHGMTQVGIEVLPETFKAHKLADRVKEATSSVTARGAISASHDPSNGSLGQDTLIGPIASLRLNKSIQKTKSSDSYPVLKQPQSNSTAASGICQTSSTTKEQDVQLFADN